MPVETEIETCGNCKWYEWDGKGEEDEGGFCLRYPPVVDIVSLAESFYFGELERGAWDDADLWTRPRTSFSMRCGEYQERQKE